MEFIVKETREFKKWLKSIKDHQAKATIVSQIDRISFGLLGDVEPVGNGFSELIPITVNI